MELVRRSFAVELARKHEVAYDNGHWIDAYKFLETSQGDESYEDFIGYEFEFKETIHIVPRVSGYTYYKPDGQLFFESNYDLNTDLAGPSLGIPLSTFLPLLDEELGAVAGGFIKSPIGPVMFSITGITDDNATMPPNGYLVVWRKVDDAFLDEIIGPLGIEFDHSTPAEQEELVRAIRANSYGVIPRDKSGRSHWMVEDVFGDPLMVFKQATPARSFYDGPVSLGSVFGFSASAALLILFAYLISRRVIAPITKVSSFVEDVAQSRDFSQRINMERSDEIGTVSRRFDQLLGLVESQEAALRMENADLENQAEHDALTGALNRRVFDRTMQRDWALAMRAAEPLSCIMLDVDSFKPYNDNYGHQAGDEVLVKVSRALEGCVQRATDSVCRFGGEEFALLLLKTDRQSALVIAERMVAAVQALQIPHEYSQCADVVTASAGVATMVPKLGIESDSLLKLADEALYEAKHQGRNRAILSTPKPHLSSVGN